MKVIFAFLRILRLSNIIFIILFMYVIRYAIVNPILLSNGCHLLMPKLYFFLLVLANCCVMAAGYIINDYFDTRIDAINKPDKVIVGRVISRRLAMFWHQALTGMGMLAVVFIAFKSGRWSLTLTYIMISGLLWFYSSSYKRQLVLGNILIAIVALLIPLSVVIFENTWLNASDIPVAVRSLAWDHTLIYGLVFTVFILILQIINDQITAKGDAELDSRTIAVVWGKTVSKLVVAILVVSAIVGIILIYMSWIAPLEEPALLRFILSGLVLPLLLCLLLNMRAQNEEVLLMSYRVMQFSVLSLALYAVFHWYVIATRDAMPLL